MSRYKDLQKRPSKTKEGKEKLETAYYSVIPDSNTDVIVLTQYGDRFDKLAHQFYGDPYLWWYIAKANNMKFNNIPAGIKIRIPAGKTNTYAEQSKDRTWLTGDEDTTPVYDDL